MTDLSFFCELVLRDLFCLKVRKTLENWTWNCGKMTLHKTVKGDSPPVTEQIIWPPNLPVTMACVTISIVCDRIVVVLLWSISDPYTGWQMDNIFTKPSKSIRQFCSLTLSNISYCSVKTFRSLFLWNYQFLGQKKIILKQAV